MRRIDGRLLARFLKRHSVWIVIGVVVCVHFFLIAQPITRGDALSYRLSKSLVAHLNDFLTYLRNAKESTLVWDLNEFIRKATHVALYFSLGFLLYFGFKKILKRKYQVYGCAFLAAVVWATLDETFQNIIPGRTPKIGDIVLDVSAVTAGLIMVFLLSGLKRILIRRYVQKFLKDKEGQDPNIACSRDEGENRGPS